LEHTPLRCPLVRTGADVRRLAFGDLVEVGLAWLGPHIAVPVTWLDRSFVLSLPVPVGGGARPTIGVGIAHEQVLGVKERGRSTLRLGDELA
jgi:hypothetical protein